MIYLHTLHLKDTYRYYHDFYNPDDMTYYSITENIINHYKWFYYGEIDDIEECADFFKTKKFNYCLPKILNIISDTSYIISDSTYRYNIINQSIEKIIYDKLG